MMAMVTATSSSPSSLQLRLAFNAANCRRFPFTLRFRTLNFNPRLRLFCVAETGNGSDKASWTGSDPKGDGFSGWSDSDAADQPDKKESFGACFQELWEWEWLGSFFLQGLPSLHYLLTNESVQVSNCLFSILCGNNEVVLGVNRIFLHLSEVT
ncbi:hypothetical protein Ahy_A05g021956 isoform D [Arachis hypogaea]|uniref:Uncharacterized protein n=1 Tax=Arachis hypogaea TaxID=3818 RepID=A0A445CZ75_ARAHY|nr:hypothetical protein Ahy_A05g021956 isoform D [Arachis hypogaea]